MTSQMSYCLAIAYIGPSVLSRVKATWMIDVILAWGTLFIYKRNSRKEEEAPPFHLISKGGLLPGTFRWVVRRGAVFTAKEEGEGS